MGRSIDLSRYLWPDIDEGRQPQYLAKINRDNPLGAKVVYASTLAGVAVDAATGKTGVNTAAVPVATPRGAALKFNGSSSLITLPTTDLVAGYPLTVSCWFFKPSTVSRVIYSFNGTNFHAIAGFFSNGNFGVSADSSGLFFLPNASIPAGWNHLTIVFYSGSYVLYLNGIAQSLTGGGNNWTQPAAGNNSIGARLGGASLAYFDQSIQDLIVFQGALSADEAQQAYQDPYQIFSTPEPVWLGAGSTAAALATDAVAQASASAALDTGSGLSASAQAVAGASAGLSTSIAMQGAAVAQASATAALGIPLTIESPADRGTLDLTNCSITPNGATPQINLKNRYIGDANATGARFTFGRMTGVNGMTPVFKVDRSNMEIDSSAKFLWSPTGLLGSWTPFTNTTKDANFYTFSHGSVFTSDTIYFASNNPWPVSYTLPWIQSLEASGFISYAPSGGTSYQFETRIATTNGATAGTGDVIPAQPLFSFKISSGGANAPDGNPKRALILSAGVHAAEDVGNYALKGAVDFLVGADAQAVTVRDWFNIFVYPMIASAGRAGGGQRNDFENSLKTADLNRQWLSTTHETVVKHKTAFTADVGATVKFFVDFHGTPSTNEYEYHYVYGPNQAKWTNAIRVYRPGFEVRTGTTSDGLAGWMQSGKSASYALTAEYQFHATQNLASVATYGADVLRAVAYLAAAGEFNGLVGGATAQATATADLTANGGGIAAAALSVSTASGALTSGIPLGGIAVSIASASGALTAQIRITGNALAQAISSAALSSGITMSAAAVSQAAAQGTLATAIQMIANAAAQATASASLTAGGGLSANAAAQATASAALTVQIQIAASALAQAAASASLTTGGGMSANALAAANANGMLTTQITLTAAALAQAIASGGLTASINLSASALSSASASAVLAGPAAPVSSVSIISAPAHRHHQPGVLYGRRHGIRIAP